MHPDDDTPAPAQPVEHTAPPIPHQPGHRPNDTSTPWRLDEQEDTHLVRGYD
ncbi:MULTISPECIES: hypothetical protein [unclassified Actinopolyspora]|uniref:hypothetical protein n=1 Tax=unclassified Actinopolyspora TaxID=2639451 RepID=UPI0013F5E46E|nr:MULTISPECIES: hypothetical protein [unclassified Actinopolyspora]NHD15596.1 hypothetical protein [Actinopolyspora sp. BKK2]NHE75191.1 hypothetical protein [Actinopolyspora sp. BKK1]